MTAQSTIERIAVVLATGSLISAPLVAPPFAVADTVATVEAKTQRMSAPNLNSQQNGWYNPGDRISLVCSARGQAVQGFFSFNVPNGGWDNLWYKTTDGNFVADVDIETGTLNVVAPDCGAAPPAQSALPVVQSGRLRVPVDGNPGVTRGFGGGGHNGIDYKVGGGTPVFAADNGTITFEGFGQNHSWMRWEAGICVLIKHGEKYTGYAHLSRTVVDNGQQVSKGQLIGYSGSSGLSTGPHLHFEVLPLNPAFGNGFAGRVDPAPFLG